MHFSQARISYRHTSLLGICTSLPCVHLSLACISLDRASYFCVSHRRVSYMGVYFRGVHLMGGRISQGVRISWACLFREHASQKPASYRGVYFTGRAS
jgi:hypothetical protein